MPQSALYDPRLIRLPLPAPFDKLAEADRGKCYSVNREDCSMHQQAGKRQMATLHPPTLYALLRMVKAKREDGEIAVGIQKTWENQIHYYCLETVIEGERYALVYHPETGKFLGIREKRGKRLRLKRLQEEESTGEEYMVLLAYASITMGPLYDAEFDKFLHLLGEQKETGWKDQEKTLQAAFVCCDNLYRRIGAGLEPEEGGIPLYDRQFYEGVEAFPENPLKSGVYAPSTPIMGEFKILGKKEGCGARRLLDLKERFFKERQLAEEEKRKVPKLPETYLVSEGAQEILGMVEKTPARIFMITGEAGVGKTVDAQMIAQVLNLPYYFFTCGPATEETELLAAMLPNTGGSAAQDESLPTYEDFFMDPASALAMVSGVYEEEGMEEERAFSKILSAVFQKGYESSKKEKDFILTESAIIKACRRPSLIEIQEPAMIEKSGTLTRLNALLDSNAATDLLNGERVGRNPETVVILTTNLDYIGCQMFNESVLSRMNLIQHRAPLSAQEMVSRVRQCTGCQEEGLLIRMANAIKRIQEYVKREEIHGGVCGYREYENWVWSYLACRNVVQASMNSVVSKASPLQEDREEIVHAYILPGFQETGEGGDGWI